MQGCSIFHHKNLLTNLLSNLKPKIFLQTIKNLLRIPCRVQSLVFSLLCLHIIDWIRHFKYDGWSLLVVYDSAPQHDGFAATMMGGFNKFWIVGIVICCPTDLCLPLPFS